MAAVTGKTLEETVTLSVSTHARGDGVREVAQALARPLDICRAAGAMDAN